MKLPTPDDLGQAPVWDNYVVSQVVAASLGIIPRHAVAYGVEVDRTNVRLRFELTELDEWDESDMDEIVSELGDLVGEGVDIEFSYEITPRRGRGLPVPGQYWIYVEHS